MIQNDFDLQEELSSIRHFKHLSKKVVQDFFDLSSLHEVAADTVLTEQYYYGEEFYLLLEGEVSFEISLGETKELFPTGKSDDRWTPIGWSGFRYPGRYATTVRSTKPSVLLRWDQKAINAFTEENPKFGTAWFFFISDKGFRLIADVRTDLVRSIKKNWTHLGSMEHLNQAETLMKLDVLPLLQRSPFFETFNGKQLVHFSSIAKEKFFNRGSTIITQGEAIDGLYILANGEARLEYSINPEDEPVPIKILNRKGLIISWTGITEHRKADVSATAVKDSVVYFLPREEVMAYLDRFPKTGLAFSKRILWLISNHLRSERSKLISLRFEQEILAVKSLLEQNSTVLSVRSKLHQIPDLLQHTYTLSIAFEILSTAIWEGSSLEKSLAQGIIDILADVYKEHEFFKGLSETYDTVVNAPEQMPVAKVRKLSAKKFNEVFEKVPHVIQGLENLPDEPNHIFILNHLKNHPYYTLPNNFQITLDSHFVSSMLLYKKYGNPGIRVVRVSTGTEYGHQDYYDRLGHIYVYTKESEQIVETPEERQKRRANFFIEAEKHIKAGNGLILSPEGTSFETHESPGALKPGAFRLALNIDPEPFIVPVVVANFDKRINHNTMAVIIKAPFKVSDKVKDPNNKEEMAAWLAEYQKEYQTYVQEAIALSQE